MKKFLTTILEFLFPKEGIVREIEKLSAYEFAARVTPSSHPNALFSYRDELIEKSLWELKYHANTAIAQLFSLLLYERIIALLSDSTFFDSSEKPIITFIPASATRLHTRHFDQGELILEALRTEDTVQQFHIVSSILARTRNTVAQHATRNKKERLSNMHEAFTVPDPTIVEGKTIIILDDILTTGATLADALRALKISRARAIYILAIAH